MHDSVPPTSEARIYDEARGVASSRSSSRGVDIGEVNVDFRGNLKNVQDMYVLISSNRDVERIIDSVGGFSGFLKKPYGNSDRFSLVALVGRWSTVTHTFQLPCVKLGITPYDFTVLTGIGVGVGLRLPMYRDPEPSEMGTLVRTLLPGFQHHQFALSSGAITVSKLEDYVNSYFEPELEIPMDVVAVCRGFYLYLFGALFFPNARCTLPVGWLYYVEDVLTVHGFDWGSAIMARIYIQLDAVRLGDQVSLNCFWQLIEYWSYEYFAISCPILKKPDDTCYPRMPRWAKDKRKSNPRFGTRFDFHSAEQQFELRSSDAVRWDTFEAFRNMESSTKVWSIEVKSSARLS